MRDKIYRCVYCGKYIGYRDIPKRVVVDFVPDSEYTPERTEMWHKKCEVKSGRLRS